MDFVTSTLCAGGASSTAREDWTTAPIGATHYKGKHGHTKER